MYSVLHLSPPKYIPSKQSIQVTLNLKTFRRQQQPSQLEAHVVVSSGSGCRLQSERPAQLPESPASRGAWSKKNLNRVSKLACSCTMGANASSALEKEIGSQQEIGPVHEPYFGLVNLGNTCYCNSVLQALFYCRLFRKNVLTYKSQGGKKENLLSCLADLFYIMSTQKKKYGKIYPKKFITRLGKENKLFGNRKQQDAQEFLNYLLNTIDDILQEVKREKLNGRLQNRDVANEDNSTLDPSWIHDFFQGTLINEIICLTCKTMSSKEEDFLELPLDLEQNTSINECLRRFSSTETLCGEDKYYCKVCGRKQEAHKQMKIKKLPMILTLYLKRFKYMHQLKRYTKLSYRVVFPLKIFPFDTLKYVTNPDIIYDLFAIVLHSGNGPYEGHYIAVVKSHDFWLVFDDAIVQKIDTIEEFYRLSSNISESAYLFFYQSRDLKEPRGGDILL